MSRFKFLKTKSKKRILLVIVAVLVLVGLAMMFIHSLNSPVNGTVSVSRTKNMKSAELTDTTNYTSLGNDYYNLKYPSDFNPDYPEQKPTNSLSYNFLDKKDAEQKITDSLEIVVKALPVGGVAVDTDYKNFTSQPKKYKLSQQYIRGELVDVVKGDKSSKERAALWVHGNYLMTVKYKSGNGLDATFTTILKNVQWLKS